MDDDQELMVLNVDCSLRRMAGDTELLCLLIDTFLEDAPHKVQRLRTAVINGDWPTAAAEAHAMKGAAATVGAERITALARYMETVFTGRPVPDETHAILRIVCETPLTPAPLQESMPAEQGTEHHAALLACLQRELDLLTTTHNI